MCVQISQIRMRSVRKLVCIGKCAYHMAKCKKKIPNYRSSLILCVVIEELRVVKGLVAYGLGAD